MTTNRRTKLIFDSKSPGGNVTGENITNALTLNGLPSSSFLLKAGGTLTGSLTLADATPSTGLTAAPKQYVDSQVAGHSHSNYLSLANGGTVESDVYLVGANLNIAPTIDDETGDNLVSGYLYIESDLEDQLRVASTQVPVSVLLRNPTIDWVIKSDDEKLTFEVDSEPILSVDSAGFVDVNDGQVRFSSSGTIGRVNAGQGNLQVRTKNLAGSDTVRMEVSGNIDTSVVNFQNTTITRSGFKVWDQGNDGSGSGLDADLLDGEEGTYYLDRANHTGTNDADTLDGLDSTSFLRSDVDDSVTAVATFNKSGGGAKVVLSGDTSNWVEYSSIGADQPRFTTRSVGTKVVYNPSLTASAVDYAVGYDTNTLWQSVADSAGGFAWYAGETEIMDLAGTGVLSVGGNTVWHAGNDGTGSGADADKLDGIQASQFVRTDSSSTITVDTTVQGSSLILDGQSASPDWKMHQDPTTGKLVVAHDGTGGSEFELVSDGQDYSNTTGYIAGNKILTDGDLVALSDADTLDGINSTSFVRSDAADQITERIHMTSNAELVMGSGAYRGLNLASMDGGDNEIGAVVVNLGQDAGNEMIALRVYGYLFENTSGNQFDVSVGGYIRATPNVAARYDGYTSSGSRHPGDQGSGGGTVTAVRWGREAGTDNTVLIIGDETSFWDYPKLQVEALLAHSASVSELEGWSISVESDLSGYKDLYEVDEMYGFNYTTSSLSIRGNDVWHEGNVGPGSGLNADLLDGYHAAAFELAGHDHPSYLVAVTHGASPNMVRPSGADVVYWIGTVEPTNAEDSDIWHDTDEPGDLGLTHDHQSYMRVVVHGTNSSLTRPDSADAVYWVGSVEPSNASSSDVWHDIDATPGVGEIKVVSHGANATETRPSADVVYWIGSVEPVYAYSSDIWHDTDATPSGADHQDSDHNDAFVSLTGDTMTGDLLLDSADVELANTGQLKHRGASSGFWARGHHYFTDDGGTMIGGVGLFGDGSTPSYVYVTPSIESGFVYTNTNGLTVSPSALEFQGNAVWHAGNDGSGSGLDADTVDGAEASTLMQVVNHGVTAATARPAGADAVYWIGSVEPTNATDSDIWHDTDATPSGADHQDSDHADAFAALSHNHAASEITSGTLVDARVAESNVTQHEAALSITESQISDLDHYTTTDANTDIDARVDKAFVDALNVDADTVDSLEASQFLRSDTADTFNGTLSGAASASIHVTSASIVNTGSGTFQTRKDTTGAGASNYQMQTLAGVNRWTIGTSTVEAGSESGTNFTLFSYADDGSFLGAPFVLERSTSSALFAGAIYSGGDEVWHEGNDGSGSGLDADTLDGNEATAFANASHTHAATDVASGTFTDARIAESNVTQHQAALSITESQISDLGDYVHVVNHGVTAGTARPAGASIVYWYGSVEPTNAQDSDVWHDTDATPSGADHQDSDHADAFAALSHNHAASEITSGTLVDARVAQSNVTQHEAALTITESQISDLGSYSTTGHAHAASDTTSGTFADARIAQSSVTQHQAALSITESQISDLDHYTTTDANTDIDARVDKAFVDALGTDAATLDGTSPADIETWSATTVSGSIGPGWITIATSSAARGLAEFYIWDQETADHAYMHVEAYRSYAAAGVVVVSTGGYARRLTGVRWIEESADLTYGEKRLQVYVTTSSVYSIRMKNDDKMAGWGTIDLYGTPAVEDAPAGFGVQYELSAGTFTDEGGGIGTTGSLAIGGDARIDGSGGISFAGDTNLYRADAGVLATDHHFWMSRSGASNTALSTDVSGDAARRFVLQADGVMEWGDGSGPRDVNLYRVGPGRLYTDDQFETGVDLFVRRDHAAELHLGDIGPSGESGILFGEDGDTNLYRSAADTLKTDDSAWIVGSLDVGTLNIGNCRLGASSGSASHIASVFRGYAAQTANLTEWQDSAGTVLLATTITGSGHGGQEWYSSGGDLEGQIFCDLTTVFVKQNDAAGEGNLRSQDNTDQLRWDNTGLGFFDTSPVAQPADDTELFTGLRDLGLREDADFSASTVDVLTAKVSGDSNERFTLNADGKIEWGSGSGAVDTNLYRSSANVLKTDDDFWSATTLSAGPAKTANHRLFVSADTAARPVAAFKGAAAQSANLTEWQNSAGTVLTSVSANGKLSGQSWFLDGTNYYGGIGVTTPIDNDGTAWSIQPFNGTRPGLKVKGAASQTANLTEWQNSAGGVLASVTGSGAITVKGGGGLNNDGIDGAAALFSDGSYTYIKGDPSHHIYIGADADTGVVRLRRDIQFEDGKNLIFDSTTGTQIGTSSAQKLGFFGTTPAAQPAANTELLTGLRDLGLREDADFSAASVDVLTAKVTGDSVNRLTINADGKIEWGSGSGAVDVNLYRSGANFLKTDDAFLAVGDLQAQSGLSGQLTIGGRGPSGEAGFHFGTNNDTNLYRSAANNLATDDNFNAAAGYFGPSASSVGGYLAAVSGVSTAIVAKFRGAAAQSANLTQWQNSAGTALAYVDAYGRFVGSNSIYVNGSGSNGYLLRADSDGATKMPLQIRGDASQTASLTEWQNSAGTVLTKVSAGGNVRAVDGSTAGAAYGFESDVDTGMYLGATGSLRLIAGGEIGLLVTPTATSVTYQGAARLKVDSTGLGFFNTTPAAQATAISNPTGGTVQDEETRAALVEVLDLLRDYGLLAT